MAILENCDTQARSILLARHLVGRSLLAHLRLAEPNVSAEHAVLSWNGQRWELHDSSAAATAPRWPAGA